MPECVPWVLSLSARSDHFLIIFRNCRLSDTSPCFKNSRLHTAGALEQKSHNNRLVASASLLFQIIGSQKGSEYSSNELQQHLALSVLFPAQPEALLLLRSCRGRTLLVGKGKS